MNSDNWIGIPKHISKPDLVMNSKTVIMRSESLLSKVSFSKNYDLQIFENDG